MGARVEQTRSRRRDARGRTDAGRGVSLSCRVRTGSRTDFGDRSRATRAQRSGRSARDLGLDHDYSAPAGDFLPQAPSSAERGSSQSGWESEITNEDLDHDDSETHCRVRTLWAARDERKGHEGAPRTTRIAGRTSRRPNRRGTGLQRGRRRDAAKATRKQASPRRGAARRPLLGDIHRLCPRPAGASSRPEISPPPFSA